MHEHQEENEDGSVQRFLYISNYRTHRAFYQVRARGWYDVSPNDLWQWFHCNFSIIFWPAEWVEEPRSPLEKKNDEEELSNLSSPPTQFYNLLPASLPKCAEIWPHLLNKKKR